MTTRSSFGSVEGGFKILGTFESGAEIEIQPQTSSTVKWINSVTFGENIPGWRSNLRNGLSATTSMTGSSVDARLTNGLITFQLPTGPGTGNGIKRAVVLGSGNVSILIPAGNPTSISDSRANALALGKFVRRAYDTQHSVMGGVIVGELRQTLQTIRNPARGLRRLVDDWGVKARKIRGSRVNPLPLRIKTVRENLADAWLEVQFGWKPLMRDIKDADKALHRYNVGQSLETRRISAKQEEKSGPSEAYTTYSDSIAIWNVHDISLETSMVIYRGAVRVKVLQPGQMDPALFGFDLASWAPTAWELVPYSFLIDYFSNIGDIILGMSSLGIDLAWCNRTTRRSYEFTSQTSAHANWPAYVSVAHVPARYVCSKNSVIRDKYTGHTVPGLTFKIPGMGSLRWLNIAALIAGRSSDRSWSFD